MYPIPLSQELLSKGRAVRALVRDVDKAKQLLVRRCMVAPCSAVFSEPPCDLCAGELLSESWTSFP